MAFTDAPPARRRSRDLHEIALAAGLPAEPLQPNHHDLVRDFLRAGLDAHLRSMIKHDPGTRRGADPEELHQMRVAVRRMRALLKAGEPFLDEDWPQMRAELGWLGGVLGPPRDIDVLLARFREDAAGFAAGERSAAARLIGGLEVEQAQSRQELLGALDSDRYTRLVSDLAGRLRTPPQATESNMDRRGALRDIVAAEYRKLGKAIARAGGQPSDDQLHTLRIRGKRLRYAAELAAPTAKRMRRLVAACKRFQDVLGEHQDARVAEERVRQLLNDLGEDVDVDTAFVAGRLVERADIRRAASRERWWSAWLDVRERGERALKR